MAFLYGNPFLGGILMLSRKTKEWLHYPILLIAIFISSVVFMNYVPIPPSTFPLINPEKLWWLFWFFIVDLVVLIVIDKLLHRYFIKER